SKTLQKKESRTKTGVTPAKKAEYDSGRGSRKAAKSNVPSDPKSVEGTKNRTRKEQKKLQKAEKKANKRPIRRIFPIWLRLIVIPLLCVVALLLGMMVGYGVIGDGNPSDALNKETWQHIIDIV